MIVDCRCLSGIRESLVGVLTSKMEEEFKEVRDSLEAIGFSKQVKHHSHKCLVINAFCNLYIVYRLTSRCF